MSLAAKTFVPNAATSASGASQRSTGRLDSTAPVTPFETASAKVRAGPSAQEQPQPQQRHQKHASAASKGSFAPITVKPPATAKH